MVAVRDTKVAISKHTVSMAERITSAVIGSTPPVPSASGRATTAATIEILPVVPSGPYRLSWRLAVKVAAGSPQGRRTAARRPGVIPPSAHAHSPSPGAAPTRPRLAPQDHRGEPSADHRPKAQRGGRRRTQRRTGTAAEGGPPGWTPPGRKGAETARSDQDLSQLVVDLAQVRSVLDDDQVAPVGGRALGPPPLQGILSGLERPRAISPSHVEDLITRHPCHNAEDGTLGRPGQDLLRR